MNLGLPLPFAAIRNQRAFLAVQNLSSFILRRLSHPDPASNFEIFLVADREQVSTPEFIARLAKAAGKDSRQFGMPPDLLSTLLRVVGQQDTHDSLIGSLELNLSKVTATAGIRRSPSMRACGWRWRLRTPEGGRSGAARCRSRWRPPAARSA
ncbi:nucleoside-diphosphate-sugar epimerase [Bradyrhizobium sp. i1.15.2]|uniref:hypothetical protein n=1 Tax=Bradyrhizobium sp. i1.15.2 TaxID=3156362 RepID=UPI0033963D07